MDITTKCPWISQTHHLQKLALYLILQICLFCLLHISSECYYYPCSCSNWKHGSYLRLLSCGSISKNSNSEKYNDINVTTIYLLLILCQYCAKCFAFSCHNNSRRLVLLLFFFYRWQNQICPLILPLLKLLPEFMCLSISAAVIQVQLILCSLHYGSCLPTCSFVQNLMLFNSILHTGAGVFHVNCKFDLIIPLLNPSNSSLLPLE